MFAFETCKQLIYNVNITENPTNLQSYQYHFHKLLHAQHRVTETGIEIIKIKKKSTQYPTSTSILRTIYLCWSYRTMTGIVPPVMMSVLHKSEI